MADGHLNVCKLCVRSRVKKRDLKLKENPEYIESERKRGREKYHRLYTGKPVSKEVRKKSITNYRGSYPEKIKAQRACGDIKVTDGQHKHHWSYRKEHWMDIILLDNKLHYKVHRFMRYSQEHKMYFTLSGTLLDTREKHEAYIESIKNLD